MRPERGAAILAAVSAIVAVGLAIGEYGVDPERGGRTLTILTLLLLFWGYVELAQVRRDDPSVGSPIMILHRCTFAWGALMIAAKTGFLLALQTELLSPLWAPTGRRLGGLLLATGMLTFGNMLPTLRSPWSLRQQPFAWQQVHRFVGWAFVLGGLGVLGCWTFLPVALASRVSVQIVGIVVVLGVGRKLVSVLSYASLRSLTR